MAQREEHQFARNAADALQCFADIQRSVCNWNSEEIERYFGDTTVTPAYSDKPAKEVYADWWKKLFTTTDADHRIYFWPRQTAERVTAEAKDYPLTDRFVLQTQRHLFFVFERPTLVFDEHDGDEYVRISPSAVSYFGGNDGLGIVVMWFWYSYGQSFATNFEWAWNAHQLSPHHQKVVSWLSVADYFARERIIAGEATRVNRHVRERVIGHVPDVNVVHLRAYEPTSRERVDSHRHIDFDARFWVSGHERNQFYPSTGEHHRIQIEPYLKGPDDKPIKDRQTVYAVTR
jgi:hypothetical protein